MESEEAALNKNAELNLDENNTSNPMKFLVVTSENNLQGVLDVIVQTNTKKCKREPAKTQKGPQGLQCYGR